MSSTSAGELLQAATLMPSRAAVAPPSQLIRRCWVLSRTVYLPCHRSATQDLLWAEA